MEIRPGVLADSPGIARVQVDNYTTAYAGIFPEAYLCRFSYQEQIEDWRSWFSSDQESLLLVAVDQVGEILAYAMGKPGPSEIEPYQSELVALHVSRPYRQQGIGRQLLSAIAGEFLQRDCRSLMLWTPENSKSGTWYEHLGGQILGERDWGGNRFYEVEIKEIAYGWLDIQTLIRSDE
jgi:GNAT superfamily N-acetyltransferase